MGAALEVKRFSGIVSDHQIRQAISDLEQLSEKAPVISVAAIHVLKNELGTVAQGGERRRILFERSFSLPGGLGHRLRHRLKASKSSRSEGVLSRLMVLCKAWLEGRDAELFRDTCDRYFWTEMVPEIEAGFGALAHPFLNTINEAIINYAEYSFGRWSIFRSISAQVFCTEGNLAYGIIRPHGLRQRAFNPLALKQKEKPGTLGAMHRGWGHTLLMQRALFISFDHSVNRRGMMIVVGPDEPDQESSATS
jgi:hypothetical protein